MLRIIIKYNIIITLKSKKGEKIWKKNKIMLDNMENPCYGMGKE